MDFLASAYCSYNWWGCFRLSTLSFFMQCEYSHRYCFQARSYTLQDIALCPCIRSLFFKYVYDKNAIASECIDTCDLGPISYLRFTKTGVYRCASFMTGDLFIRDERRVQFWQTFALIYCKWNVRLYSMCDLYINCTGIACGRYLTGTSLCNMY